MLATENNNYLTKQELASILRVSTRTINNYAKAGTIPKPVKLGRKALWPRAHLLTFLSSKLEGAVA